MIQVRFKNLEKSELARQAAVDRVSVITEKFPDLLEHKISVTLGMENSPLQAGPDVFTVKLFISGKRYKSLVLEKAAPNLYMALSDVEEHALERLNRFGDKTRVRQRSSARRIRRAGGMKKETEIDKGA